MTPASSFIIAFKTNLTQLMLFTFNFEQKLIQISFLIKFFDKTLQDTPQLFHPARQQLHTASY